MTTHPFLAPRLRKEYSYTSTPPFGPSWPILGWTLHYFSSFFFPLKLVSLLLMQLLGSFPTLALKPNRAVGMVAFLFPVLEICVSYFCPDTGHRGWGGDVPRSYQQMLLIAYFHILSSSCRQSSCLFRLCCLTLRASLNKPQINTEVTDGAVRI